jgi:hypothetical protein
MGRPTRNSTIQYLNIQAWVTGTGGAGVCCVLRQASNTSFEVVTSAGVQGICYLSAAIVQPGQMMFGLWQSCIEPVANAGAGLKKFKIDRLKNACDG